MTYGKKKVFFSLTIIGISKSLRLSKSKTTQRMRIQYLVLTFRFMQKKCCRQSYLIEKINVKCQFRSNITKKKLIIFNPLQSVLTQIVNGSEHRF